MNVEAKQEEQRPSTFKKRHSFDRQLSVLPSDSKAWVLSLFVARGVLSVVLFRNFKGSWIDRIDFNSACWSQSAHNTLRAGLRARPDSR
jgi:hypothetical protein